MVRSIDSAGRRVLSNLTDSALSTQLLKVVWTAQRNGSLALHPHIG